MTKKCIVTFILLLIIPSAFARQLNRSQFNRQLKGIRFQIENEIADQLANRGIDELRAGS